MEPARFYIIHNGKEIITDSRYSCAHDALEAVGIDYNDTASYTIEPIHSSANEE